MFRPPAHLVKKWPEVFEDLHMDTMPVAYMNLIRFKFEDGRIWEIDINSELASQHPEDLASSLIDMLEEYQHELVDIDFDIDVDRLKSDISDKTKDLL